MATEIEEQQAKEFLKRAEIITMKKDLLKLREADSLKERDKIATIKTLEEQQAEQASAFAKASADKEKNEKFAREGVLQKNANQEYEAEKDLKDYATEQERQQIFLFESQRLGFENQTKDIDEKKDPALKLEKNNILLQITGTQTKLNSILEQEKKLEDEQKFIIEKEHTSAIPSEKKSLEQRRGDIEKEIQEVEKTRWAVEKQIQDLETKIKTIDQSSEQLVLEKNGLRDKILGVDKSLREIYSAIIARVEEKRRGESEAQKAQRVIVEKARTEKNEKVQRAQWSGKPQPEKGFLKTAPETLKIKIEKTAQSEEEQRKKFLQDIEVSSNKNIK